LVGVGIHWGFDFSLDMADRFDDQLSFGIFTPVSMLDTASLGISRSQFEGYLPAGITYDSLRTLLDDNLPSLEAKAPLYLSRKDWNRSVINFGGKVFLDAIKFIDAVEISFNIGAWEYDASLKYPNGQMKDGITANDVEEFVKTGDYSLLLDMEEQPLTLDAMGMSYLSIFGISKTPYVKMQFDVSIRKNLIAAPKKTKMFKLYLGGGPSLHLGTPIITPAFVQEVLEQTIESAGNNIDNLKKGLTDQIFEDVLTRLINDSKTPTFGMHLMSGIHLKPPVIPLGFYVDGKFMIPFSKLDDTVDIGGTGFLLNAGISFSL
jgi:hypothetical protein